MESLTHDNALDGEAFETFETNQDTTSEEDAGEIAEDDMVEESKDSDATGEEAYGMVTDDGESAVGEDNGVERFHWEYRRKLTWKTFKEYVEGESKRFKQLTESEQ
jgi:hypothetical protein